MVLGPAVVLVACAVLCVWRRRSAWPFVMAAAVAGAVACWQVTTAVLSVWNPHRAGQWDPAFHGIKFAALALVVGVDLAAAVAVLRARPRAEAAGQAVVGRIASPKAAAAWLVLAAVLYVFTWYIVATTGE